MSAYLYVCLCTHTHSCTHTQTCTHKPILGLVLVTGKFLYQLTSVLWSVFYSFALYRLWADKNEKDKIQWQEEFILNHCSLILTLYNGTQQGGTCSQQALLFFIQLWWLFVIKRYEMRKFLSLLEDTHYPNKVCELPSGIVVAIMFSLFPPTPFFFSTFFIQSLHSANCIRQW